MKDLALKGIKWNLIDKLFNQLLLFLVTIYLAKVLGPENFGLIGMLNIFIILSDNLVKNGLSQALIQRSHRLTEEESSTAFYTNIIIGLVLYFLLYISAPFIADFFKEENLVTASRYLFLIIIINSFATVPRAKLNITIDFKSQAIGNSIAIFISSIVALRLAFLGYGYWALIALTLTNGIVSSGFYWYFSGWRPKLLFCNKAFKSNFKFGSNIMMAGLVATLVNNLYVIIIGRFYNTTTVGYFTQASNTTNMLSGVMSSSLLNVTYPLLSSINDDKAELRKAYMKVIQITMLFSLPIMIGFAAISDLFTIILLGEQWLPIIPILLALSFARALTPINAINMNILNVIDRSDLYLKVDLMKLPVTICTLLISIPFGIKGISIAIVVNSLVAFFINTYYPGKFFGLGAIEQLKLNSKFIFATVVMYFTTIRIEISNTMLEFLTKIIFGIFIYMFMLALLQVKPKELLK